jgi:hypothetical protein
MSSAVIWDVVVPQTDKKHGAVCRCPSRDSLSDPFCRSTSWGSSRPLLVFPPATPTRRASPGSATELERRRRAD